MMEAVKVSFLLLFILLARLGTAQQAAPLRVGIVGLVHNHVGGFLNGGALVPAGAVLTRPDVQVVGVVEPDDTLFASYAVKFHFSRDLHFHTIEELAAKAHPQAALIFTSTADHTEAVERCARLGIHVMMEKPMAVSYKDALTMQAAAQRGKIHVLVDYETSWYASNKAAYDLLAQGALGSIVKTVVRDGHEGPKLIHVAPEFFKWLTDPKQNGAGALFDFGCYGVDLMTWLMHGEAPLSVSAITRRMQPEFYPNVDDESDILLTYKNAVSIIQGSWDWPFAVKDMDLYGRTGYAKTIGSNHINVRRQHEPDGRISEATHINAPYDDPLHYMAAVIRGDISEGDDVSSLKTNMVVSEILDAARQSAETGKTITLPLR